MGEHDCPMAAIQSTPHHALFHSRIAESITVKQVTILFFFIFIWWGCSHRFPDLIILIVIGLQSAYLPTTPPSVGFESFHPIFKYWGADVLKCFVAVISAY